MFIYNRDTNGESLLEKKNVNMFIRGEETKNVKSLKILCIKSRDKKLVTYSYFRELIKEL